MKFLKTDAEGGEINLWNAIGTHSDKIDYLAMETHRRLFPGGEPRWLAQTQDFIARNKLAQDWRLD